MNFTFRLEPLLKHTLLLEAQKQQELAGVLDRKRLVRQRLREKDENIKYLLSQPRNTEEGMNRFSYDMQKVVIDASDIEELNQTLINIDERETQVKQELAEIGMKRDALEDLKEKQKKDFNYEMSKKEQEELEEIHRYIRAET